MTFGPVTFRLVIFGPVTDERTESDAYEPTVHYKGVESSSIKRTRKLHLMSMSWPGHL